MTMGRAMSSKVRSAGPSLCWRSSSRIIVPSRAGWLTGGLKGWMRVYGEMFEVYKSLNITTIP